ncbi:MAG TPA: trigger factor [Ktedonobacteraceae bacterium]|nr:trigger factor [Ktedonobacteraceae bacterium]
MKVSVEKLPSSEALVAIDFSWEEVQKASDKAYRKLVQKVDVPGFRRGKAPRSILERRLGKESIYQEGLDDLMTETYRNALKEYDLTPLAQPEIDAPEFEVGEPYHFTIKVPILSPVELGDYRSLHFEREEAIVTAEEVEQELESMRSQQVQWIEVQRPAQIGDRITVDLKLTVEDATISDLKDNPFELTDERHGLFSGMDEHIVGMSAGESKTFTTTIPADYANEKIAGKEASFAVTVHKVESKEVPELDDALAARVSNGQYETLEDLRKAISDRQLETKKRRIRDELRERVVDAVIEQAQVTVHHVLVHEEAEEMMHQLSHLLEQQRMSMDQYLMLMRKSRQEYLEELEPEAEKRVKRQLVLDAVAEKEEIEVSPEEVESLFRAYAQIGQNLPQSEGQIQALATSLRREKAITKLVTLTTDPDPDEEIEEQAEEEASIANAGAAARAGEKDVEDIVAGEEAQASESEITAEPTETEAQ